MPGTIPGHPKHCSGFQVFEVILQNRGEMYTPWLGKGDSLKQGRARASLWHAWFSAIASREEKEILKNTDTAQTDVRQEVKARLIRLLLGVVAQRWKDAGKRLVPHLQWEEKGRQFDWKSPVDSLSLSWLEGKLKDVGSEPPTQEFIEKVRAHMILKKCLSQSSGQSPSKKRKSTAEGGVAV